MANAKPSMKIIVDRNKSRVLFAEAGKECVDFLIHLLSLPLGTVLGLPTKSVKSPMAGSIGNFYECLEKLSTNYLQEGLTKDCLLNPNAPLLAPDDPKPFYICVSSSNVHEYVSDTAAAFCPSCKSRMTKKLTRVAPPAASEPKAESSGVGGYMKGLTYMIMDDLTVEPMSTISVVNRLYRFNVQDMGRLEEKWVTLDMKLGLALLKASLSSKTVLSDVFL